MEKLIFDRSQADVDRAKELISKFSKNTITLLERAEWNAGLKGTLNAKDLNRIEDWTKALATILTNSGYAVDFVPRNKAWTKSDIPSLSDFNRLRQNVTALRDGFFSIPNWRPIGLTKTHDYKQANDIEWDLQLCADWLEKTLQETVPCGVYNSGNVSYLVDPYRANPIPK